MLKYVKKFNGVKIIVRFVENKINIKMKLEKLTPEQEALIPVIRDKWLNQLFDLKELNVEQLLNGVKWLYNFCNLKTPKVVVCNSIIEAQLTAMCLKNIPNNVRANVGKNVGKNVWANVRANVRQNVRQNVEENVWQNVRENVGKNVGANVGANVRQNVRQNVEENVWQNVRENVGQNVRQNVGANVGANVRENVEFLCSYGDINDYGWVSFFDYFTEIGVLKNEDFNSFKVLISSNYYSMIQMENICLVIQNPNRILRNSENQLNSTKDYAIKFKDGTGMYFVNGVYLSDDLFNRLKNKIYSFEDWTKETNEEIKASVLAFFEEEFGSAYMFDFISKHLKEIDTYTNKKDDEYLIGTTKGVNIGVYTLFKGKVIDTDVAFVRCYCPSTNRMFFLGVDPINTNAKDAIASLYRVPKILVPEIKSINRQGERYSTVFTEEGKEKLKNITQNEVEDLVPLSGEDYFNLIKYEY